MTSQFDGDLALILTPDGGDVQYTGGQPVMDAGGLETAVNISLFTGPGWWGNGTYINEPVRQIGSRFEAALRPHAVNPAYLRDVEQAGRDALQWLIDEQAARDVQVSATWPQLNRVEINILIEKFEGDTIALGYELNWSAGFENPVVAKIRR